jgi:hypothetical protein
MHPNYRTFVAEMPVNDEEKMREFQEAMDVYHDEVNKHIEKLAKELGVSDMQAGDIFYLRSRSRWSQELENRIIAAHKATKKNIVCTSGEEETTLQELGF